MQWEMKKCICDVKEMLSCLQLLQVTNGDQEPGPPPQRLPYFRQAGRLSSYNSLYSLSSLALYSALLLFPYLLLLLLFLYLLLLLYSAKLIGSKSKPSWSSARSLMSWCLEAAIVPTIAKISDNFIWILFFILSTYYLLYKSNIIDFK